MSWGQARKIQCQFDGGGSHNGSPAGWGWAAFENGREIACGNGGMAPGTSNNEAEYRGLIMLLRYIILHNWDEDSPRFEIYGDSDLVVHQVNREWGVKAANLRPLWQEAVMLLEPVNATLHWHARRFNSRADMLATEGRTRWTRARAKRHVG